MHYQVFVGSYVPVSVLFKQVKHAEDILDSYDHLHLLKGMLQTDHICLN